MNRTRSACIRLSLFLVLLALVQTASAWHVQADEGADQPRFDVADSMEWPAVSPIAVVLPVVEETSSDDPVSAPAPSTESDAAASPRTTSFPTTPLPFLAASTSPEYLQVYRC